MKFSKYICRKALLSLIKIAKLQAIWHLEYLEFLVLTSWNCLTIYDIHYCEILLETV